MFGRPQRPSVPDTTAEAVYQQLQREDHDQRPLVVDVREPDEWLSGHINGALHMPLGTLQTRYQEIPTDREVVMVCHLGSRSEMATAWLRRNGYDQVLNLRGGMDAWEGAHLPIDTGM